MELLQLRYFRSAAQLENFSKAAEKHMIPQSAMSKTIRKLENELGCELFDRQGKKISLNDNGRLFLKRVDDALHSLDMGISELRPKNLHIIRVYVQSGIRFIPDLTAAFEQKYPNSKVVFYQGEPVLILGVEFDFTFFQLPIDETLYHYRVLMEDEIALAVPSDSKLAHKKEISLSSLKSENFISFCKGNQLRALTEHLCKEQGFCPKIIFEANESSVFRTMIEANTGLALVPSISWNTLKNDRVTLVPLQTHPKRQLALVWKKSLTLSADKQLFLDFATNWFSQFLPHRA